MLEAEQTCLQATRLFALAIKACEDGDCDSAYELTKLASEAFDHEPAAGICSMGLPRWHIQSSRPTVFGGRGMSFNI